MKHTLILLKMRTYWGQMGSKKSYLWYYTWVHKYVKQGSSKYPKKSGQKGREGEDQPSPKLEVMGSVQMVGDKCGGVYGAGGGVVMLWERGKGGVWGGGGGGGKGGGTGGLGGRRQSDSPLSATTSRGTDNTRGVFWGVKGTWGACRCLGK